QAIDMHNVDALLLEDRADEALEQLAKMEKSWEVEWRLAQAMFLQSNSIEDNEKRRLLCREALVLAESSFSSSPLSSDAAKTASIIAGSISESATSSLEQMKIGALFKKYLDATIQLLSEPDMVCLHMRGRFSYKVASLSFVEKTLACKLVGSLPACSYDDALKDLLAADSIESTIENDFILAKTYLGKGDKKNARIYFTRVVERKAETAVHEEMVEESKKRLTKL
ncbi:hypothetical protein PFISCL1PPCAC_1970, partial [Pristionchus fissidentatus]